MRESYKMFGKRGLGRVWGLGGVGRGLDGKVEVEGGEVESEGDADEGYIR